MSLPSRAPCLFVVLVALPSSSFRAISDPLIDLTRCSPVAFLLVIGSVVVVVLCAVLVWYNRDRRTAVERRRVRKAAAMLTPELVRGRMCVCVCARGHVHIFDFVLSCNVCDGEGENGCG